LASFLRPGGLTNAIDIILVEIFRAAKADIEWFAVLICGMLAKPVLQPPSAFTQAYRRFVESQKFGHSCRALHDTSLIAVV
jgi:hypothetical protein